jgi:hypothetical protein
MNLLTSLFHIISRWGHPVPCAPSRSLVCIKTAEEKQSAKN